MKDNKVKIILIGDEKVGKTQIINQFVNNKFSDEYTKASGTNIVSKEISYDNGKTVKLELWETKKVSNLKSINAYILVYDVTNQTSFDNIKNYIEEIKKDLSTKKIPIILVGNKNDLLDKKVISTETAQNFADQNGMTFFETSMQNNVGINTIFQEAAKLHFKNITFEYLHNGIDQTEKDQNLTKSKLTWDFWRSLFTSATALSFTTLMITAITAVILSQTGHLGHVAAYATLASVGSLSLIGAAFSGGAETALKIQDITQGDKKDFIKNALSFCHRVENEKESKIGK
jgi:Ras-related protein Rab-1A